jgi:hypothetical protein
MIATTPTTGHKWLVAHLGCAGRNFNFVEVLHSRVEADELFAAWAARGRIVALFASGGERDLRLLDTSGIRREDVPVELSYKVRKFLSGQWTPNPAPRHAVAGD